MIILGQKNSFIMKWVDPTLDYNIAKRIIGKEYKMVFVYAGRKMIDSLGIEHFEKSNRLVGKKNKKTWR